MPIRNATALRSRNRRLDRNLNRAELVLRAMKDGASLHLQYARSGPIWVLTTGQQVSNQVAKLVVASSSVVGVGDALFGDRP